MILESESFLIYDFKENFTSPELRPGCTRKIFPYSLVDCQDKQFQVQVDSEITMVPGLDTFWLQREVYQRKMSTHGRETILLNLSR